MLQAWNILLDLTEFGGKRILQGHSLCFFWNLNVPWQVNIIMDLMFLKIKPPQWNHYEDGHGYGLCAQTQCTPNWYVVLRYILTNKQIYVQKKYQIHNSSKVIIGIFPGCHLRHMYWSWDFIFDHLFLQVVKAKEDKLAFISLLVFLVLVLRWCA